MRMLPILLVATATTGNLAFQQTRNPKLERADKLYDTTVGRARGDFEKIQGREADRRLKTYREVLVELRRSGDTKSADALAEETASLEKLPGAHRPRPAGRVSFGDHEYAIIDEPATWHAAQRKCQSMGGHLACVNSAAEQTFLQNLTKSIQDPAWLGASDEDSEGTWMWVDGTPVTTQFGKDNQGGIQHYLVVSPNGGAWDDTSSFRFAFVCEWDN